MYEYELVPAPPQESLKGLVFTLSLVEAILTELDRGQRVELLKDKDGNIKAQTISRKVLKY